MVPNQKVAIRGPTVSADWTQPTAHSPVVPVHSPPEARRMHMLAYTYAYMGVLRVCTCICIDRHDAVVPVSSWGNSIVNVVKLSPVYIHACPKYLSSILMMIMFIHLEQYASTQTSRCRYIHVPLAAGSTQHTNTIHVLVEYDSTTES